MVLLMTAFQAQPGRQQQLARTLQRAAVTTVQHRNAEAVLICVETDDGGRVLWFEQRRRGVSGSDASLVPFAQELEAAAVSVTPHPKLIEFLDGFYRFPLPPCRLWKLRFRTSAEGATEPTPMWLERLRTIPGDPRVLGMALYRVVDNPHLALGFLALTPGTVPEDLFARTSESAAAPPHTLVGWHPVAVAGSVGRLTSDTGGFVSPAGYPPTAFWARSQPLRPDAEPGGVLGHRR